MFGFRSTGMTFTAEDEEVLEQTTIDRTGRPGSVLHDFEVMLDYVRERDLRVTGSHQLPLRALPEINARLARPIELGLQRPVQKSFPPIHGLYLLVRASGLTYVDEARSQPLLRLNDDVYRAWQTLNPTEQYFTLLETWLLRGKAEIVGEGDWGHGVIPGSFGHWAALFGDMADDTLRIAGDNDARDTLAFVLEWHNLGVVDLFGLVDVHTLPPEPGEGWRIERVDATPFGKALLALLYNEFFSEWNNILALVEEDEPAFGWLQPVLQPYFPEWQNNLSLPKPEFRPGTHVFKVSLGRIWWRIAIPAARTLDRLASAILNAVRFTHDHLYEFRYRNRYGAQQEVHHSFMDEGPWVHEVRVGDLPLQVGQSMTFVYDFGDWWEFGVTLEGIDADMKIDGPTVLESHGEPPEQYPDWGAGEDWDEE
jgi:hypothetical protein